MSPKYSDLTIIHVLPEVYIFHIYCCSFIVYGLPELHVPEVLIAIVYILFTLVYVLPEVYGSQVLLLKHSLFLQP